MLSNVEIDKLREYILNAPDEELNDNVDGAWKPMCLLGRYISPVDIVAKVREGKFDRFNVDDDYFRLDGENCVSSSAIKFSVEEREGTIKSMLSISERKIPEAIRNAIGWKEKDFDFTKIIRDTPYHWENEGYSYYLKRINVYNIRDFKIIITRIDSQLDKDIKAYAEILNPYDVEKGMKLIDIWWNNAFKDRNMHPIAPMDTRYYYRSPEAPGIVNNLCKFGDWSGCDNLFEIGLVAKFERVNEDGSFDGIITGLEYGSF